MPLKVEKLSDKVHENLLKVKKQLDLSVRRVARAHHVVFDVSTLDVISGLKSNIYIRQGIAKIWNYFRKGLEIPDKAVSYWY